MIPVEWELKLVWEDFNIFLNGTNVGVSLSKTNVAIAVAFMILLEVSEILKVARS